jgi:DNA-binding XRE family transcriptional regulator
MAGKPRPLIIEKDEFRAYLAAMVSLKKQPKDQTADEMGISRQALYQLLEGEIAPSDEIARKIGLRPVFVVEEELRGSLAEPKAKPKGKR